MCTVESKSPQKQVWFSAGVAALQTSGGGSTGVAAARRRCAVTTVSAAAAASSETAALARVEPVVLTLEPSMMLQRAVPPGLVYRDALLRYTGLMLPRPSFFDTAYYAAVDSNLASSPRFGAENGESAETWRAKAAYRVVSIPRPRERERERAPSLGGGRGVTCR